MQQSAATLPETRMTRSLLVGQIYISPKCSAQGFSECLFLVTSGPGITPQIRGNMITNTKLSWQRYIDLISGELGEFSDESHMMLQSEKIT